MKVFLSLILLSFIPWLQAAQVLAPDLLSKAKKCQDDEVPYRVRVNKRLDLNCYKVVELPDLEGNDLCFTGKFFSLKKSDSEEPVCFDQWKSSSDEEITTITRAATVYISLTKARNFYLNHSIYASKVANEKYPITVRIDQKASFDQSSETAPFNLTVEAKNNALTIGPSDFQSEITVNDKVIKPWNKEIWFNQAIPAKVQSTLETAGNIMRQRKVKNIIMYPFYVSKTYDLIEESAQALQNDYYADVLYNPEIHLYTLAIAQAVVELIPEIMRLTGKLFHKKIYLDTAMFPEAIYHEYTHVVLGDYFHYTHYTALNEGVAHYYASLIAGYDNILVNNKTDMRGFAVIKPNMKDEMYTMDYLYNEEKIFNSFTYSFFKDLEKNFGKSLTELLLSNLINNKVNDPQASLSLPTFVTQFKRLVGEQGQGKAASLSVLNKQKIIKAWTEDKRAYELNQRNSLAIQKKLNRKDATLISDNLVMMRLYQLDATSSGFNRELFSFMHLKLIEICNKYGF